MDVKHKKSNLPPLFFSKTEAVQTDRRPVWNVGIICSQVWETEKQKKNTSK